MWNNLNELKEMLNHLENLKVGIMKEINRLDAKDETKITSTVYPLAKVKPSIINGYPVFQFSYEGMLPHYKVEDYDYLAKIRYYYFRATLDSYNFDNISFKFDQAVIIYVQYFKNMIIRDLENRNKGYIQDAIRHTGIINDDNWQNVWSLDTGFFDEEKNHVQVYVVSRDNLANFYDFLLINHENMKKDDSSITNKEKIFLEYQEEKMRFSEREKHNVFHS